MQTRCTVSTLVQCIPPGAIDCAALTPKPDASLAPAPMSLAELHQVITAHHHAFQMDHSDRPHHLARILYMMYKSGVPQNQLVQSYYQLHPHLVPLSQTPHMTIIHRDNWQEHLGHPALYRSYLAFFDKEIAAHGISATLQRWFFDSALSMSVGAQLQPLVHVAFGVEQQLDSIVAQGLAYMATSYTDASAIIEPSLDTLEPDHQPVHQRDTQHNVLFDMVAADPRFDGRMDSADTLQAAVKVLLKSQAQLLSMYVQEWIKSGTAHFAHLASMAVHLMPLPMTSVKYNDAPEMNLSVSGHQHLDAILAMGHVVNLAKDPHLAEQKLKRLQFLSLLCTYIVQGRPRFRPASECLPPPRLGWQTCTQRIVHQSSDHTAMLALDALSKAKSQFSHLSDECLRVANLLVDFVDAQGTWNRRLIHRTL